MVFFVREIVLFVKYPFFQIILNITKLDCNFDFFDKDQVFELKVLLI
ncbi:Uncharacterised protein [Providencia rustigianii]|nr:Uncharacterised protein [Providencia rustigianii]